MQSTTRPHYVCSHLGDLIIEGRAISARIDSFCLTSASPALKRELKRLAPSRTPLDVMRISLPDNIPDDALKCLLILLYPSVFGQTTLSSEREWALALILAVRWQLDYIRTLAISALDTLLSLPVDRAVAGDVLNIPEWVSKGMDDLAKELKPTGLTVEEMDTALRRKRDMMLVNLGLGRRS